MSDEQHWKQFTKQVRKLPPKNRHHPALPKSLSFSSYRTPAPPHPSSSREIPAISSSAPFTVGTNAGVDKNLLLKIKKGVIAIEATLDLHGLTVALASAAVEEFISRSYLQGLRLILIITGKGKNAQSATTLQSSFESFLNTPRIRGAIIFSCNAAPAHGGTGAFYIYLKKNKAA